jgi:hypothetical protein
VRELICDLTFKRRAVPLKRWFTAPFSQDGPPEESALHSVALKTTNLIRVLYAWSTYSMQDIFQVSVFAEIVTSFTHYKSYTEIKCKRFQCLNHTVNRCFSSDASSKREVKTLLASSLCGKRECTSARSPLFRLSRITQLLDNLPTLEADPTILLVGIGLKETKTKKKYPSRQWQIKARKPVPLVCTAQCGFHRSA